MMAIGMIAFLGSAALCVWICMQRKPEPPCAWCFEDEQLGQLNKRSPVSHGICPKCKEIQLAEFRKLNSQLLK